MPWIANSIIIEELSRIIYVYSEICFLVFTIVLTVLNGTFSVYYYGLRITDIRT